MKKDNGDGDDDNEDEEKHNLWGKVYFKNCLISSEVLYI